MKRVGRKYLATPAGNGGIARRIDYALEKKTPAIETDSLDSPPSRAAQRHGEGGFFEAFLSGSFAAAQKRPLLTAWEVCELSAQVCLHQAANDG